ncbi:MAG: ribose-5-phosphate isomerase RpiA [Planctomycetota bacterium]
MPDPSAIDDQKRHAADAAIAFVESHTTIGLGSGSTAAFFIKRLAEDLRTGKLVGVRGVPTSHASAELARRFEVPLVDPGMSDACDVVVDGADEVDDNLNLVKGLGGALLREKIVAQASKRRVIVVDDQKLVSRLGTRSPLPIEVVPWALPWTLAQIEGLGDRVVSREVDGKPFVTDNGNRILDLHFSGGIADAASVATKLAMIAGVVETGLFLDMADVVLVAGADGVRTLRRGDS